MYSARFFHDGMLSSSSWKQRLRRWHDVRPSVSGSGFFFLRTSRSVNTICTHSRPRSHSSCRLVYSERTSQKLALTTTLQYQTHRCINLNLNSLDFAVNRLGSLWSCSGQAISILFNLANHISLITCPVYFKRAEKFGIKYRNHTNLLCQMVNLSRPIYSWFCEFNSLYV